MFITLLNYLFSFSVDYDDPPAVKIIVDGLAIEIVRLRVGINAYHENELVSGVYTRSCKFEV